MIFKTKLVFLCRSESRPRNQWQEHVVTGCNHILLKSHAIEWAIALYDWYIYIYIYIFICAIWIEVMAANTEHSLAYLKANKTSFFLFSFFLYYLWIILYVENIITAWTNGGISSQKLHTCLNHNCTWYIIR